MCWTRKTITESKLLSTHTLGVATSVKKSNPIRRRIAFCVICTI
ncbi:hypothetical protein HMPREF9512_02778 [Enterococcus faecalis EnGen0311]|nr:hypothetical protein HMPREF9512_02778 [Enterococcus faecalis EnGen0311]